MTCSVDGCDRKVAACGWCYKHYLRFRRTGTTDTGRYVERGTWDAKAPHIFLAEKALGHALPPGSQVHHVDEDDTNDTPANLVICPDQKYHHLLHRRMRALLACGNPNWLKCEYCKKFDDPNNLYVKPNSEYKARHRACHAAAIAKRNLVCL